MFYQAEDSGMIREAVLLRMLPPYRTGEGLSRPTIRALRTYVLWDRQNAWDYAAVNYIYIHD